MSSKTVRCPGCGFSARIRLRSGKNELRCPECGREFNVWE